MSFVGILRPFEDATSFYGGQLTDKDDEQLTADQIATMTMTLYDVATSAPINGRWRDDVRNGGAWDQGVTISTADSIYNLEMVLTAADNAVVGSSVEGGEEQHRLLIEGTLAASGYSYKHEVDIRVKHLVLPTTS